MVQIVFNFELYIVFRKAAFPAAFYSLSKPNSYGSSEIGFGL